MVKSMLFSAVNQLKHFVSFLTSKIFVILRKKYILIYIVNICIFYINKNCNIY